VVYGTDLDKITGRVKLSVVGYGRKTQEGGDTLGGRSATELSAKHEMFITLEAGKKYKITSTSSITTSTVSFYH
jgi:hypothetical protein